MKRKLLILFITTLSLTAYGQKTDTVLFEGVSKIIIKNSNSAKDNFALSGKILIDNSYFIGSKDMDFLQIVSDPFPIQGNAFRRGLIFYIVNKDNEIIITTRTRKINSFGPSGADTHPVNEPINYTKKLELSRVVYSKASELAKSIGGKIIYSE